MPISGRYVPSVRCADLPPSPSTLDWPDDVAAFANPGVCGIVLAGTHHWGAGAFERELRGPLLPVAQTPVIQYVLEWLREAGIPNSVVCANSSTAPVRSFLGDGSSHGLTLDYFEDHVPRGPAGCAHDAARRSAASTFVVVEGTLIPSLDLRALLAAHWLSRAAATVVVEVERRNREVDAEGARLPGGIYVFDRRVLEQVMQHGYQDIKQGLLERLHAAGEHVAVHEVAGVAPRVLDYQTYASVSRWLITRAVERPGLLTEHQRVGDGRHHPTADVDPTARLIGPVLLGARTRIGEGAVIVGPASIGADSVIARGALVSRSVIWDHCVIGEHAIVDASLLADRAVVLRGERVSDVVRVQREQGRRFTPTLSPPSSHGMVPVREPETRRASPAPTQSPVQLPSSFSLSFRRDGNRSTGEHPAMP